MDKLLRFSPEGQQMFSTSMEAARRSETWMKIFYKYFSASVPHDPNLRVRKLNYFFPIVPTCGQTAAELKQLMSFPVVSLPDESLPVQSSGNPEDVELPENFPSLHPGVIQSLSGGFLQPSEENQEYLERGAAVGMKFWVGSCSGTISREAMWSRT